MNVSTRAALAVASGLALALAFPNFDLNLAAWIAFVPLLYAIDGEPHLQRIPVFVAAGLRMLRRLAVLDNDHAASLRRCANHFRGAADVVARRRDRAVQRRRGVGRRFYHCASRPLDRRHVADRLDGGRMVSHVFSDRLSVEPARLRCVSESDTDPVRGIHRSLWRLGADRSIQCRRLCGLFSPRVAAHAGHRSRHTQRVDCWRPGYSARCESMGWSASVPNSRSNLRWSRATSRNRSSGIRIFWNRVSAFMCSRAKKPRDSAPT